ncbi:glucose-1-phosphate cytidylyltransferase [Hamadaea sp. NPDC050747]|uniref:glucose-1-phosphate cytidylyltransferase n=1 Tax=Hamadaea sp. NPDC050747 TaxID=3155789 RepID=UPI0034013A00
MKVVLFCGGLGMRMREGGSAVPKPMALLGERPLLWHVMRYYAYYGHTDFVLCLGYGATMVKDYFLHYDETLSNDFTMSGGAGDVRLFSSDITDWNITFINTGHQSTIGERLMRVRAHVENEPMFLCNYADTLTDAPLPEMIDKFAATDKTVSMLAVPPFSTHHYLDIDDDGQVTGIRGFHELTQWENGGYFIMRPDIFDELREGEDIVPHALDRLHPTGRLMAQRYKGFWRAVDTFKDRAEMEELVNRGLAPWMLWTNPALVA